MYRGYDIHEMGDKATFEEVAYLLLNGELPNAKQLREFKQQIASERALPKQVERDDAAVAEEHASDGHASHRRVDAWRRSTRI